MEMMISLTGNSWMMITYEIIFSIKSLEDRLFVND